MFSGGSAGSVVFFIVITCHFLFRPSRKWLVSPKTIMSAWKIWVLNQQIGVENPQNGWFVINGRPYFLMDDWELGATLFFGGKTSIFGSSHIIYAKICEEIQTVTGTANHRPPTDLFQLEPAMWLQHLNLELGPEAETHGSSPIWGGGFWQVKLQSWKTCVSVVSSCLWCLVGWDFFFCWSSLSDLLKKGILNDFENVKNWS